MAVRLFDQQDQSSCPRLKRHPGARDIECDPDECDNSAWQFNGEDFKGCPVKNITQQTGDCIRMYRFFKMGILPRHGGLLDQGARYIEAMETIDREINLIAKEKEEKGK